MGDDARNYAKITVDFWLTPKVGRLSDGAFRCLIEMILWSKQHMTDGLVPEHIAMRNWRPDVLAELCENHPDRPSVLTGEDGYLIRDYVEHQTTNADIEAIREKRKAAARARWDKHKQSTSNASAMQNGCKPMPETETETETEVTTSKKVQKRSGSSSVGAAKPRRATRLPDGWMPSQKTIDSMKAEFPHLDFRRIHETFTDYWAGKAGQGATKVDWDATWRNWVRREAEKTPTNGQVSGVGRKIAGYQQHKEHLFKPMEEIESNADQE